MPTYAKRRAMEKLVRFTALSSRKVLIMKEIHILGVSK
jgi:hypothetical protein